MIKIILGFGVGSFVEALPKNNSSNGK